MLAKVAVYLWLPLLALITATQALALRQPSRALTYGVVTEDGASGIHIYDIRTAVSAPLLDDPRLNESAPLWSPDGTQLLFEGRSTVGFDSSLYTWAPGEQPPVRVLSSDRITGARVFWSYDGARLLWREDNYDMTFYDLSSGDTERRIVPEPLLIHPLTLAHLGPGRFVVLGVQAGEVGFRPYLYDAVMESTEPMMTTPPCDHSESVAVSRDGRWLAFTCLRTPRFQLMNLATQEVSLLTDALPAIRHGVIGWAADDQHVLINYFQPRSGTQQVFDQRYALVNTETGALMPVLDGVGLRVLGVDWLPEGVLDAH
ncbi:MAG: hypothetical protein AAF125_02480 [Chloroflexota bacterium]